jgi:replicative DNA helicase
MNAKKEPRAEDLKYLPIDSDAERSVIAAALTSPETFYDLRELLTAEDFGVEMHQLVYKAMLSVEAAGRPVDVITTADELRRMRTLTKVGGVEALNEMKASGEQIAKVGVYSKIVAEKSLLRKLIRAGSNIVSDAIGAQTPASVVLEQAETAVYELGSKRGESTLIPMAQAVANTITEMNKTRNKLLIGHSTGWAGLDRITGGLQPGQLLVIAARPGVGKSAFALQMARHVSATTGLLVPFLSYEMGHTELTLRMASTSLRYDMQRLRQNDLIPGMERDVAVEWEKMSELQVHIDDNPPSSIGGVRSMMRRLASRAEIGAIFIDYIQLMEGDQRGREYNRVQEVSQISRGLKRLASELSVPIVALSQLSRDVEKRPNKRPMLSDLRESGSIEQDASVVAFLYRDHLYNAASDADLAECIIAKQRNGPVGTVFLEWTSSCARFDDTERTGEASSPFNGNGGNGYPQKRSWDSALREPF